jgi:outer membrane protein TolC
VREAAWRWSAAQAEADAAAAQVQYLQRLANDVQRRVHSGDLARADALAARAELLDAQSLLGEVRQRLLAAQAQWRNLTGLEAMPEVATPSTLFAGLDAETSEEHPELQLAAQAMERARKRVEVVNTSRRDAPELLLRYREESPGTGQAAQRSVGIGVRIPFGTDGRNAPLQAAALGDLDVAETTELRLRERQEADLGLARSAVRNAARQLEDARDRASLLRERTQLIDKSFQAGETPLPELLRAANAAAQADAALARQQAALGLAQALLQQTLGLLP